MTLPHAVILAGGAGTRLGGVRKADLRIGGVRLLDRVTAALGPVGPPLLISTGPLGLPLALPPESLAVPDLMGQHHGPLGGLLAALSALADRGIADGVLVSVAVDTPCLPTNFAAQMAAALGDAPACFAAWGDDFYPPHAAWRIAALAAALPGWHPDNPSVKGLQSHLGARRIDWAERQATNPFANLNTLADLVQLGRRPPS